MSRRPVCVAIALSCSSIACHEEVPLGAWTNAAAGAGGAPASAGGSAGSLANAPLPACLQRGDVSASSPVGQGYGATETATDWTWPSAMQALEWEVVVEREIERATPSSPPNSGYYFTHKFSFVEGVAGLLGIQAEGGYQLEPPNSPVEITKIAVFWLSGPPLAAELGDIAYPDARVAPITASGVNYQTIHARFPWRACRTYRFRFGPHSTESDGSIWYGAWIEDRTTSTDTFLGRMLLPPDSGALAPFSISRTIPIVLADVDSCDVPDPISVLFGVPRAQDGRVPILHSNRFVDPFACPRSSFVDFPGAVRHVLGREP